MYNTNRKDLRLYIGLAVCAFMLCGMVAFWITESVLILQRRQNATNPAARLVQATTILETMMMDQVYNASFENGEQNKDILFKQDFKT